MSHFTKLSMSQVLLAFSILIISCSVVNKKGASPADYQVKLIFPQNRLFVGSYTIIPVKIQATSGLTMQDLEFTVPAGAAGGQISLSRDAKSDPNEQYITLLTGYKPGRYQLLVNQKSTGALLDSVGYIISTFWTDEKEGPSVWISGDYTLPGVRGAVWGGGSVTDPEHYNTIPISGKKQVAILLLDTKSQRFSTDESKTLPLKWDSIVFKGFLKDGKTVSAAHYYREISYNNLQFEGQVFGPVELPGEWSSYLEDDGNYKSNIWQACATAGDDLIDFSKFQYLICAIRSVDATDPKNNKWVWAHADNFLAKVKEGDIPLAVLDIMAQGDNFVLTTILCHELGHNLGLGDLYPWGGVDKNGKDWGHPKHIRDRSPGEWALMDDQGQLPHMIMVHKMMLGWIPKDQIKLYNFQTMGGYVDEKVMLHPIESSNPRAGSYSGVEVRIAPGRDYYFEYRVKQPKHIGDQNLPSADQSIGSVLGTDVDFSDGYEDLNRRKPVLLLEKDADGDGPVLALGQDFKGLDTSDKIPTDFTATVTKIDGQKAELHIEYGISSQPDPMIRPWNPPLYQSPDIEVRNERNVIDPAWKNVPWEGYQNTLVAKVTNAGKMNAPGVWVDFYIYDLTVNNEGTQPIKIGDSQQDILALQTSEFETVWLPKKAGHYCIEARIRHYQTPGPNSKIEVTEFNNKARSNYVRFISEKASPPSRELATVKVHNPFPKPARTYIRVAKSTSPLFRTYLEHSWLVLQPGESREVQLMFEYVYEEDPVWMPSLEEYLTRPNTVSVIGYVEVPDADREAAPVPLGGVSAQVVTGIATEIENFTFDPPQYCGGHVLKKSNREPVTEGKVIITIRQGDQEIYQVVNVNEYGHFQVDVKLRGWESLQAYYTGTTFFGDAESPIINGKN